MKHILMAIIILLNYTANSQNTILWKVSKNGLDKVSYILGTYHQMGNSFVDSLPVIRDKLLQSELAVFESTGKPETIRMAINQRPATNAIEKIFDKDGMATLLALSKNWGIDIYKLNPIELLVKLQQEYYKRACGTVLPTDTWSHFDHYLISIAEDNHIKTAAFETDSIQVQIINASRQSWKDLKKPIHTWMKHNTTLAHQKDLCQDAQNYKSFRFNYMFSEKCENDLMLDQRNQKWMNSLPELLEHNNCFIAVGLLHLFRACGLIERLREMGYIVEPVSIKRQGL